MDVRPLQRHTGRCIITAERGEQRNIRISRMNDNQYRNYRGQKVHDGMQIMIATTKLRENAAEQEENPIGILKFAIAQIFYLCLGKLL